MNLQPHVSSGTERIARITVHRFLDLFQTPLQHVGARILLQTRLICRDRLRVLPKSVESRALPSKSFAEAGVERDTLLWMSYYIAWS